MPQVTTRRVLPEGLGLLPKQNAVFTVHRTGDVQPHTEELFWRKTILKGQKLGLLVDFLR